jgi:putative endonuclease
MEKNYTYILYSKHLDSYYIGSTKDIDRRLQEHNRGKSPYTKRGLPWELVYQEEFETKSGAYQRELQIKSWKSRIKIEELLKTNGV